MIDGIKTGLTARSFVLIWYRMGDAADRETELNPRNESLTHDTATARGATYAAGCPIITMLIPR